MGEFNSYGDYIYYCGQESLRRNEVAIIVNKRVQNAVSKTTLWSLCFQGKPFNITVIQVYALTNSAEEAEVEQFYEDLQDLLELTSPKDVLFIIGDWNANVGSKEIPGVTTKFCLGVQKEAGQRLIEFCQESALVIANTLFQQHKRRLYTWTSPDSQYQNQIDYILCSQRWSSSIQSAKTRLGVDCGSDHEVLISKFKLKLIKQGKPLDHSGMTWIKSLMIIQWKWQIDSKVSDLIDRMPEEQWMEVRDILQKAVIKTIPKKKKCKKAKMIVYGGLTNSWEEKLKTKEKRKDIPI